MRLFGALAPLLFVLPSQAGGEEEVHWSRFRGPGGAGCAEAVDLPDSLSEENILWRVELAGRGHSSPIAWGDLIFLTAEAEEQGARFVLAYSASDGREVWRVEDLFEAHGQHDLNSFASTTPTCDAERVIVVWSSGDRLRARALDHEGQDLWERELGSWSAGHGSASSAVLIDGVLVVAADHEAEGSFLMGLDPESGEPMWRRERTSSRASFATPTTRALPGGGYEVLMASTSHGITSLDPESGELRWETGAIFEQRCVGSPVVAGPIVFASAGSGGGGKESVAVALEAGQDGHHPVLWKQRRSLPYVPTAVYDGQLLYLLADGGILTAANPLDGEILWSERTGGSYFASPILADGRLWALDREGLLRAFTAGPKFEKGPELDLGQASQATPAVVGKRLILRTETHLLALGVR